MIVKMPNEEDQIFDFEKNVKINSDAINVLTGNFKNTKLIFYSVL